MASTAASAAIAVENLYTLVVNPFARGNQTTVFTLVDLPNPKTTAFAAPLPVWVGVDHGKNAIRYKHVRCLRFGCACWKGENVQRTVALSVALTTPVFAASCPPFGCAYPPAVSSPFNKRKQNKDRIYNTRTINGKRTRNVGQRKQQRSAHSNIENESCPPCR